jgi:hypothetical protein|tara:strand:- start:129 stop:344 length:216 start_codon:yes stop_codon:yes gene_type:complete
VANANERNVDEVFHARGLEEFVTLNLILGRERIRINVVVVVVVVVGIHLASLLLCSCCCYVLRVLFVRLLN